MYRTWKPALLLYALATVMPLTAAGAAVTDERAITAKEFREEIAKRDGIIIDLLRRVKALEARIPGDARAAPTGASAPHTANPRLKGSTDAPPLPTVQAATKPTAPGQIVVDELTAQRALERSLVNSGALLLESGQVEIAPSFIYQHSSVDDATAVNVGGLTFVADNRVDRDTVDAALSLRLGLPWDSQVELSAPYRFVARDETVDILGSIQSSQDTYGHGVGDLRIGLAKTILREADGWPDLIGRVSWDTGIGKRTDNGVALGFGFDELQGQLTALYRQDPMVFVGTVGYEYTFERDNIRPGEEFLFSLGTNIAVSPETSLSFFLDQVYSKDLEFAGRRIDGSDQLSSSFTFGTSIIVGPRALLRLTAGIGLTNDAPDYSFSVSLPVRFRSGLN